ncbi:MAG: STN domain-containing protein [Planctomycetaceae bacterium]
MTEKTPWLCPHCDIPLRILEIQPGEQIVPCPECHEPIQIVSAGRQIREIRPVVNQGTADPRAIVSSASVLPLVTKRIQQFLSHPRAVSLTATTVLGVSLIALWAANRSTSDSPVPATEIIEPKGDVKIAIAEPVPSLTNATTNLEESQPVDVADDPAPLVDADPQPDIAENAVAKLEAIGQLLTEFNRQHGDEFKTQGPQPDVEFSTSSSANVSTVSSAEPPKTASPVLVEPPSNVDVNKSLEFRIARWEQSNPVPFGDLLGQLEELAGGSIQLADPDSPAMQNRLKLTVSFHYKQKTLAAILEDVLHKVDLRYEIRDNTIHVFPAIAVD